MFFITRIHYPRISPTSYENAINVKLRDAAIMQLESHKYDALLRLREQATNMASSLHQLRGTSSCQSIAILNEALSQAISAAVAANDTRPFQPSLYMGEIKSALSLVKNYLKDETSRKFSAGVFLFANSILACSGIAGIAIFSMAASTGPVGIALLGLVMAILSTFVLMIAAYSMYVDGRTLFDSQIKEIEGGIKFLNDYPALLQKQPEEQVVDGYREGVQI